MEQEKCCSGCSRPDLPWGGRGTDLPIFGCRFTLYPMSDAYVNIILGALEKTDTSAVWSETDALSTVYRGGLSYVTDAVKALFVNAYRPGVHMALEGQFSHGCPGDIDGDSLLDKTGTPPNDGEAKKIHFPVHAKLSLYPLGDESYIDEIARVWYLAKERGLNPRTIHYATRIDGDVHEVFSYLHEVCEIMEAAETVHHYVLHFTMNCCSPTEEG